MSTYLFVLTCACRNTTVGELKAMLDLQEKQNLILCYGKKFFNPMLCLKSNLNPIVNLKISP